MNSARASRGAGYRPGRKRRASTATLVLLAAVLAVSLLATLSARAFLSHNSCTDHPIRVRVAAAGEIQPAIQRLAQVFNGENRFVGGRCAQVLVQAASPATVANELAYRTAGGRPQIDAWIPDSNMWVQVAQGLAANASNIRATGIVVAQSPLLIAMPRPVAARTPAFGTNVSWRFLFPENLGGPPVTLGLHVEFPDPAQSAVGLATLIHLRKLYGFGRPARFAEAGFVFNSQVVAPTPASSLPSLAALAESAAQVANSAPVTVTSEQAVVRFDQAHPREPLAIRYPVEGTYQLTYPYVLTTADSPAQAAAQQFGDVLRSSYAAAYVRYEGFRSSNGAVGAWPQADGLSRNPPPLLTPPASRPVLAGLRAWQRLDLGARYLALIDVSSAMGSRPAPGGPSLEQVLGRAAGVGLARFPDSTQMGLWAFASHLNGALPYRELIPLGPLPAPFGLLTRRQQIQRVAAKAAPTHIGAALYGTILDGYKQMIATFNPRYHNVMIVMTAGVENAAGDISAPTLIRDVRALYNPNRKVEIVVLMVGASGNFPALEQIAQATNGQAFEITNPSEISQVFYHAMGRRICQPHCPGSGSPAGATTPSPSPAPSGGTVPAG